MCGGGPGVRYSHNLSRRVSEQKAAAMLLQCVCTSGGSMVMFFFHAEQSVLRLSFKAQCSVLAHYHTYKTQCIQLYHI